MNFYVDTSVLVSALTPEVASHQSRIWLGAQSPGSVAISPWVETEFQSALSLKVRTGRLTIEEKVRIATYFRARLSPSLRMIGVESEDFEFAANSFDNHRLALRAGDALHLAIAARNGLAFLRTTDSCLMQLPSFKFNVLSLRKPSPPSFQSA